MSPFPARSHGFPRWRWPLLRLRGGSARPDDDLLPCHIDAARSADGHHALLHGWAEGADSGELYWIDGAAGSKPLRLDLVIEPRDDVQAHLLATGRSATSTRHGFWTTVPLPRIGLHGARLCRVTNGVRIWSRELAVSVEKVPLPSLLSFALTAARRSGLPVATEFLRLARPLVAAPAAPPGVAHTRRIGPAGHHPDHLPRASIIVPFYGEDFFLLDHLMAQSRAPDDVEWLFVCDDPVLAEGLGRTFTDCRHLVRQPTTLITLDANGGFAHANNIGAAHAHGTYLLLMNSDVYCDDFTFLDRAMAQMDQDPSIGCVGFSMRFEDGTVQHEGMQFQRVPWFEGLWASEHPGKGLPAAPWGHEAPVDAEAVTAALMLLRRADFPDGRVFDPRYVLGDFEDGDLCLRLRQQGLRVKLLRAPGIWHLERQSITRLSDGNARFATTWLNCLRFNERWGAYLDETWTSRASP